MANLCELFDNVVQMQALNGVPLANGHLYVYALGRTRLMDTWSDIEGESLNTNPIILDDAGQCHCYVSDAFDYTLVICDEYNNEVFSIDKYLYSKGEHSHADVAVAPSEHIGVSSYHVGETTVYVPYIQGELGKTYHGIEPIVVNNQENKISARNIPLGVQSPLYFAEDSESACIIGMSGEYQPVTGMSGYATTGDLVDMAESISETYQPKGDYQTAGDYYSASNPSGFITGVDLTPYMEESKLETAGGKITGYDGTAFAGGGSVDPSEFIPWSASGNFATSGDLNDKLDTTAFSTVSGDFITAIPDSYATKDFVSSGLSSKLDESAFSTVSGDFITALPTGLLNESGFEYDGDKISAYNGSAFVGQGGGGITGEYELSAGNGISIDNYPIEQKTVISVTGNYATEDWVTGQGYLTAETDWTNTITAASANAYNEATAAIPAPFDPSYLSGQIDNKLDSAIYAEDSGKFLTAHQSLADYQTTAGMTAYQPAGDYLTTGDSANFYTTANESGFITGVDLTPYQTVEGMTAYQPVGDYYSASNPSGFITGVDLSDYATTAEVADKQDITGMTAYQPVGEYYSASNPSGFITGVDLTPYQLTADMTAYQSAGDYLTTADSANFYTTANESGFITGVPGTYLQNSDLTIIDNKITEISGVPLSAGDELPESVSAATDYVTATSANIDATIDNVSANSGVWGGSALPISAGPGIKFSMVDNTLVASTDETILFSGNVGQNSSADLSDSWHNFDKIKVYGYSEPGGGMCNEARVVDMEAALVDGIACPDINLFTVASWVHRSEFNIINSLPVVFSSNSAFGTLNERLMGYWNGDWNVTWDANRIHVTKIVGINRIAGGE